ncbi:MAG: hypothetical protein WBV94_02785 [Blastocatellia bacterium]
MKKKKPEIETDLRAAQPEEVAEWSQQLAGHIEARKAIKAKAKASARDFKMQLEANEEECERLSRMIITQQEEVPVKRQMTLAEIEDRARHELSLEEFKQESEAFKGNGDHSSLELASSPELSSLSYDELVEMESELESIKPDARSADWLERINALRDEINRRIENLEVFPDASPELASKDLEAPDGNTIEGGLYRALHRYHGGEEGWQKLRKSGATDTELKAVIGDVFGLGGGGCGPDMKSIAYKGGKKPAFYFDKHSAQGKPTLEGKALIEKAREVLGIPQPTAKAEPAIAGIDDAEAEEMYRAYDRMKMQMIGLQEKARNPRDDDESRYISKMIEETRDGLIETERDWTAFVAANKERAEAIHRKVSGEHEVFNRERMQKMVKEIMANKKLSFEALARFGYEYEFVLEAETAGLIHRKTNLSNFEAGPMPPKKSKPKASPAAPALDPIAQNGDVVETDPFYLVPDDKHKRNWLSLSDLELSEWKARLSRMIKTAKHDQVDDPESEERLKRVEAAIRSRDAAWSKADAAGGEA